MMFSGVVIVVFSFSLIVLPASAASICACKSLASAANAAGTMAAIRQPAVKMESNCFFIGFVSLREDKFNQSPIENQFQRNVCYPWCTNSPSPSLFRMLRWICSRCLHCHKISSLSIKRRRPLLKLHIIYSQFITRNLVFQEGVFICGITNLTVKSLFLGRPVKVRLLTALRKKSGECLW